MVYSVEIGYHGRFQKNPKRTQFAKFTSRRDAERWAYNATKRGHAVSVDKLTRTGQRGVIVAGYKGKEGYGLKNYGSFKRIGVGRTEQRMPVRRAPVRRQSQPLFRFGGF